jgi:hypothetical protein
MAKSIRNEAYIYRARNLSKNLMIEHIKEVLDVKGYVNGSDKVLKMDMCQASYLRGIYKAIDVLTDTYITLDRQGGRTAMLTDLLGDELFADYIVDRYAFEQKLFPATYKEWYDDAVENDDLVDVNFY